MVQGDTGQTNGGRATADVQAGIDELRGRLEDVGDRALAFIRERPGTSLLIAAAAGYLIGRILR